MEKKMPEIETEFPLRKKKIKDLHKGRDKICPWLLEESVLIVKVSLIPQLIYRFIPNQIPSLTSCRFGGVDSKI